MYGSEEFWVVDVLTRENEGWEIDDAPEPMPREDPNWHIDVLINQSDMYAMIGHNIRRQWQAGLSIFGGIDQPQQQPALMPQLEPVEGQILIQASTANNNDFDVLEGRAQPINHGICLGIPQNNADLDSEDDTLSITFSEQSALTINDDEGNDIITISDEEEFPIEWPLPEEEANNEIIAINDNDEEPDRIMEEAIAMEVDEDLSETESQMDGALWTTIDAWNSSLTQPGIESDSD